MVFQDFTRYPLTAAENVTIGAPRYASKRQGLEDAAHRAGALELIDSLPDGWDTVLAADLGGVDLSGGQWQRLALARALFAAQHGARVLVLDEPTAWLDVRGEAAFYDRFLETTKDLTTLVISHRFSTVRLADHIVVIDGGHVLEEGTHHDLVGRGEPTPECFGCSPSISPTGTPNEAAFRCRRRIGFQSRTGAYGPGPHARRGPQLDVRADIRCS